MVIKVLDLCVEDVQITNYVCKLLFKHQLTLLSFLIQTTS